MFFPYIMVAPYADRSEARDGLRRFLEIVDHASMHQRPYERLIAWQEAYALCLRIYAVTRSFPAAEQYALTNQLRRAATSVPLNIAEGNTKRSSKDKAHFLDIAHASLEEVHCEARLARDLEYVEKRVFLEIDDHVQRVSYLMTKMRAALV